MAEPVIVRRAEVADAAAAAAVLNSVMAEGGLTVFDRPFSAAEEAEFIGGLGPRSALHVALRAGQIVGLQSVDVWSPGLPSMGHVATMGTWIRANARGCGIGRQLADVSFGFARERQYRKVFIHVLTANAAALAFYRALGFVDVGVARAHVALGGRFHDETHLEKPLVDDERVI
jgi:ribosomal protein S18 acetylase RimI-like enzyme